MTVDAVIVGSGPGGATVADVLTAAGWTVAIVEKGRNHLLDPDDLTRPASDFSNDEVKFRSRYFLGPDPLVEPRTFRTSRGRRGADASWGRSTRCRRRSGGGGTHADGKVPRFRPDDFRPAVALRPPGRGRRRRLAARLRRTRAVLRRGGAVGRAWPAPTVPTRSPVPARDRSPCRRGHRCSVPPARLPRPSGSATTPTRRRPRPTASPTTAGRRATTAASARSSAARSTPRATRWRCCAAAMATGRAELLPETFASGIRTVQEPGHRGRRWSGPTARARFLAARHVVVAGRGHRDAPAAAAVRIRPPADRALPDDPLPDHRGRQRCRSVPTPSGAGPSPTCTTT